MFQSTNTTRHSFLCLHVLSLSIQSTILLSWGNQFFPHVYFLPSFDTDPDCDVFRRINIVHWWYCWDVSFQPSVLTGEALVTQLLPFFPSGQIFLCLSCHLMSPPAGCQTADLACLSTELYKISKLGSSPTLLQYLTCIGPPLLHELVWQLWCYTPHASWIVCRGSAMGLKLCLWSAGTFGLVAAKLVDIFGLSLCFSLGGDASYLIVIVLMNWLWCCSGTALLLRWFIVCIYLELCSRRCQLCFNL